MAEGAQELPLPEELVAPARAADWSYAPAEQHLLQAAEHWRRVQHLRPAGEDARRVLLLLIDVQKDFCLPEGSLYVGGRSGRGAVEDAERTARLIYRNLHRITEIVCTMDTHHPWQIFFPAFWLDAEGRHPPPHTTVRAEQVRAGLFRPHPAAAHWLCGGDVQWLAQQAEFYCAELERRGKYTLYLWPPHCLLGSPGHALTGVLQEARLFHALCRGAPNPIVLKGDNPLTEHYSALAPEVMVRFDGEPLGSRNQALVEKLLGADALLVAGQAASHCVKWTLEDLLGEIERRDERLARKIYILRDCTSAVAVPDPQGGLAADFTPQAEQAFARFAAAGMHLVESTSPMADWLEL
ncbi:MAG: hypothetical protein KatS3mg102_2940 [Planctomycetota bacterium]|nr:MAG: hypothetical protein KatS3mg102_2940 [Planctomycetota bacterium]